jgi:glycosyltransferase involved in cell wall biosynthesis
MVEPKFSICVITKNEATTIPRLVASLKEFQSRGGEILVVDTGSSDKTATIARELGCTVHQVGTIFKHSLSQKEADEINSKFVVGDEPKLVEGNNQYFNFSEARNHCASLAKNNMVSFADADEVFTKLDIDKINSFIDAGFTQFEYNFVYAHDHQGKEIIKFVQSKMYDKRLVKWVNCVHEVLSGPAKIAYLDESIFKLEHFQIPSDHRSNYLPGLAIDCYMNQDNDRNSHYFAREMMYCGRYKSAIKEFERHIEMKRWPAERAQSMIFIGDCYGYLGKPDLQVEWYNKAIHLDPGRREAFIKLARFYRYNDNKQLTLSNAYAATLVPWTSYYANDKRMYEDEPWSHIYWAKGWLGDIKGAQEALLKCLEYQPHNTIYLRDTKYYFEYADQGIDGYMTFPELQFLYECGKTYKSIVEIGSFKGRSTHALCSACSGEVYAVDTWKGSTEERDGTYGMRQDDVLNEFRKNLKDFLGHKLTAFIMSSEAASHEFKDTRVEMVFIDATHTYASVKRDIELWLPKTDKIICGHDYCDAWPGVVKAVDEAFGKPDKVVGTIWVKYL